MIKLSPLFLTAFLLCSINSYAETNFAEDTFEKAWKNPNFTQIELNDVDVNEIIKNHYVTDSSVQFTRTMLWDMETKKAWDPVSYIPYAAQNGLSWGRKELPNGNEVFVRSTDQKQWLNPEVFEQVFELVYLNHQEQKATFLGVNCVVDPSQRWAEKENEQPLFHVQHVVGGTEESPLNKWKIVHLTIGKDPRLIHLFKERIQADRLPGYIENYIIKDLRISFIHEPKSTPDETPSTGSEPKVNHSSIEEGARN